MKRLLKGLLAMFAGLMLFLVPTVMSASNAPKNKIAGHWMLIYEGKTYYKLIEPDGRFLNLAPDEATGIYYVSRQGTYTLEGENHYVETITHEWGEAIAPDKTDITYTVKRKKLILDFEKYGQSMYEEWEKTSIVPEYKTHK